MADRADVLVELPKRPDEPVLWESKIELGEKFFQEIISHPVPLDMNILKALKRSSLGLDLYLWLDLPHLLADAPDATLLAADLPPVRSEPGQGQPTRSPSKHFRRKVLRELVKIKMAWPGLNYAIGSRACLEVLCPSVPTIPSAERLRAWQVAPISPFPVQNGRLTACRKALTGASYG